MAAVGVQSRHTWTDVHLAQVFSRVESEFRDRSWGTVAFLSIPSPSTPECDLSPECAPSRPRPFHYTESQFTTCRVDLGPLFGFAVRLAEGVGPADWIMGISHLGGVLAEERYSVGTLGSLDTGTGETT